MLAACSGAGWSAPPGDGPSWPAPGHFLRSRVPDDRCRPIMTTVTTVDDTPTLRRVVSALLAAVLIPQGGCNGNRIPERREVA